MICSVYELKSSRVRLPGLYQLYIYSQMVAVQISSGIIIASRTTGEPKNTIIRPKCSQRGSLLLNLLMGGSAEWWCGLTGCCGWYAVTGKNYETVKRIVVNERHDGVFIEFFSKVKMTVVVGGRVIELIVYTTICSCRKGLGHLAQ